MLTKAAIRIQNRPWIALGLLAAAIGAIVIPYFGFVPLWDSGWYFADLSRAVASPFRLINFNLGHLSPAYFLLMSLSQYWDRGNVVLLHASNLALGIASVFAFFGILSSLDPRAETCWERLGLTAIYGLMPVFLSNLLYLSPDFGVLSFFLLFLHFRLAGKTAPALILGFCLVFSKELGAALYGLVCAAYFTLFVLARPFRKLPPAKLWRSQWLWALPAACYLAWFGYSLVQAPARVDWMVFSHRTGLVHAESGLSIGRILYQFIAWERQTGAYLADVFVLNFNWLFLAVGAIAFRFGAQPFPSARHFRRQILVWTLFLGALYVVTRTARWNNVRYLLPVFPLFLLAFYPVLLRFRGPRALRLVFLAGMAVLVGLSNFRTLDPLSRAVFGTFPFGTHRLLTMDSLRGVKTPARDALVYNLEYFHFHSLPNRVFEALHADPSTVFVANKSAGFFFPGRLRYSDRHRSSRPDDSFEIGFRTVADLEESVAKPPKFYFLELPNLDNRGDLRRLAERYPESKATVFDESGYRLVVHEFTAKN